jgi:hypothetical protein
MVDGKAAFVANVMRIEFHKPEFNRSSSCSLDPSEDVIRRAVRSLHARLRFTTRAAHASPIDFPLGQWRLQYLNDDGSELDPQEGYCRARGTIRLHWSCIAISTDVWHAMFAHPPEFVIPVWEELRLDAVAALPHIGTAVVLGATALEVFIATVLDALAVKKKLSKTLWEWIRSRDGKTLQQPSVEEQYDVLLEELSGHSLKEDPSLWEAFKNLKTARNAFVHEGAAAVGTHTILQPFGRAGRAAPPESRSGTGGPNAQTQAS